MENPYAVIAMHDGPAVRGWLDQEKNEADKHGDSIWLVRIGETHSSEVHFDDVFYTASELSNTRESLDAFADGCDALAAGSK